MILFTLLASSDDVMAPQQSTLGGSPTTVVESGTTFPDTTSLSALPEAPMARALTDAKAVTTGSQPQSPVKPEPSEVVAVEEPQSKNSTTEMAYDNPTAPETTLVTDPNAGTTTTDNNNDVAPDESAEVPANDPEASTSGSNHNDEDAAANNSDSDNDPVISDLKAKLAAARIKRLEDKANALLEVQPAAAE